MFIALFVVVIILFFYFNQNNRKEKVDIQMDICVSYKEPVKNWKQLMNPNIGTEQQECPYCHASLSSFPKRKTKCKKCNNYFYSKERPYDDKRVIVKEDELELIMIDELKKYGEYEKYLADKKRFSDKENELKLSQDTNEVSYYDVKMCLYEEDRIICKDNKEFASYRGKTRNMASLSFCYERYMAVVSLYLEAEYIDICHADDNRSSLTKTDLESMEIFPLVSFNKYFENSVRKLNLTKADLKKVFFEQPIIIGKEYQLYSKEDAWKYIEVELKKFMND